MNSYISTAALYYPNEAYLAHHGIKGQKWGVRRYQNPDGTLTEAGKRRLRLSEAKQEYRKANAEYSEAKKKYNKAMNNGFIAYNPSIYVNGSEAQKKYTKDVTEYVEATKKHTSAKNEYRYVKEDVSSERILERLKDKKDFSKRFKKYEQQYLDKGMTADEAKVAAYKRERTEKIMAVAGGVAVAAITAYGVKKYMDYTRDVILPKNMELGRVSPTDTDGVRDGMFAYIKSNKMDVNKYKGYYAKQMTKGMYSHAQEGDPIYEKSMHLATDLKMASRKNAARIFQDTLDSKLRSGDKNFAKAIKYSIREAYGLHSAVEEAFVKNGKITPKVYDAINSSLSDNSSKILFKDALQALKDSGYSAIADRNDQSYSGFSSKLPLILLDTKGITLDSVLQIPMNEINSRAAKAKADIIGKAVGKAALQTYGSQAAAGLAIAGIAKVSKSKRNDRLVADYKEKHPGTKMTYQEIVRMYERGQFK